MRLILDFSAIMKISFNKSVEFVLFFLLYTHCTVYHNVCRQSNSPQIRNAFQFSNFSIYLLHRALVSTLSYLYASDNNVLMPAFCFVSVQLKRYGELRLLMNGYIGGVIKFMCVRACVSVARKR